MNRPQHIEDMINMLEPKNVQWHVITDVGAEFEYKFDKEWIHHYLCPNFILPDVDRFDRYYNTCNWILSNIPINDDEMYMFLSDDDGYEPDFFDKITSELNQMEKFDFEPDLVITSMERGHQIPVDATTAYPTFKLHAHPDNVVPCQIGGEQYLMRGSLLKRKGYRFPLHQWGDGLLIQQMYNENINKTIFCPNANVWFNYFEPGRWNR